MPGINTEFHQLLYELSRSPRLIEMISGLGDRIYRFRRMILKRAALARISHADHRSMLQLIRQRRPVAVEKLVREHILRGQVAVLDEFDGSQAAAKRPGKEIDDG